MTRQIYWSALGMPFTSTDQSFVFSFTFLSTLSILVTSPSKNDSGWFILATSSNEYFKDTI